MLIVDPDVILNQHYTGRAPNALASAQRRMEFIEASLSCKAVNPNHSHDQPVSSHNGPIDATQNSRPAMF